MRAPLKSTADATRFSTAKPEVPLKFNVSALVAFIWDQSRTARFEIRLTETVLAAPVMLAFPPDTVASVPLKAHTGMFTMQNARMQANDLCAIRKNGLCARILIFYPSNIKLLVFS